MRIPAVRGRLAAGRRLRTLRGEGGRFDVRHLKGPRPDPLVRYVARLAAGAEAGAVADAARADMRGLMERLADRPADPAPLPSTLYDTEAAAVAGCATPPEGGALLYAVARALRPRNAVEIGAAHGYGAFYIASALRWTGHGHLHTLEGMDARVAIARDTVDRLGVGDRVTVVPGDFAVTFRATLRDAQPVDLVFSDGDKSPELTADQFAACLEALDHPAYLFFDDVDFSPAIARLFAGFVAHPGVARAATFRSRWALLEVRP